MFIDIFNCVTISFVIIITFAGFILPGCRDKDSKKEFKTVKKTSTRICKSVSSRKTKKSEEKRRKINSKKQVKSAKKSKKDISKKEDKPKDINDNVLSSMKKDGDLSEKDTSKKEATKKVDEKDETSLKEGSTKESHKKIDDKNEQSLKEVSKKEEYKKMELFENHDDINKLDNEYSEIKPSEDQIIFKKGNEKCVITIENKTNVKRALKFKCSDIDLFRVDPIYSYVEPGQMKSIEVIRMSEPKKIEKLIVLHTQATPNSNESEKEFKKGIKYNSISLTIPHGN